MKAVDIANNNKISVDEVIQICGSIGISCKSSDDDISGNDIFFIETKIAKIREDIVTQQKKAAAEQGQQKIRLKRKVKIKLTHKADGEVDVEAEKDEFVPVDLPPAQPEIIEKKDVVTDDVVVSPVETVKQTPIPAPVEPHREVIADRTPRETVQRTRPPMDGQRPPYNNQGSSQGQRPPYNNQGSSQGQRPPYNNQGSSQGQRPPYNNQGGGYGQNRPPFAGKPGGPPRPFDKNNNFNNKPGFAGKPSSSATEPLSAITNEVQDKKDFYKDKKREKDKEKEDKKSYREEKIEREGFIKKLHPKRKKNEIEQVVREVLTPKYIEIIENITVGELARKLNIKASELISRLMKLGLMATINHVLDSVTAEIIASEFGTEVKTVSLYDETVIKDDEIDDTEKRAHRPPIVTVMGHVDHGKTKLLDAIRSANVVGGEFGGITQHIGAYQVMVSGQPVTFLDTPGHEAFTTMRARGAKVTDIVILVVAANDSVMPQTIEAINHAKAANVPIIVAINKIDLQDANPTKVKQDLTKYELIPEEWGGQTLFVEISAKQQQNISGLLEMIIIQSEVLDLKANYGVRAKGTVIESRLDQGRGAISTILVQNGVLKVGDPFVVGIHSGRVRAMFNDQGKPVTEATPSMPVEVLGFDGIPSAGDPFQVVVSEKYAKQISHKRQELRRIESAKQVKKVNLENLNEMIKDGEIQEVKMIIKADVDGSVQALRDSLEKLSTPQVRVRVIHAAAGSINESDIMLASASSAIVIGYHVRPMPRIAELAEREKVSIKTYNIIFEVTDSIKMAMEGMLAPEMKEEITGTAEIKQIYKISKLGSIAGCVVMTGKIVRNSKARLLRDGIIIYDGSLKSLKHFKDDASEVINGAECGITLEKFNDLKPGDIVEGYKIVEIVQKLK